MLFCLCCCFGGGCGIKLPLDLGTTTGVVSTPKLGGRAGSPPPWKVYFLDSQMAFGGF